MTTSKQPVFILPEIAAEPATPKQVSERTALLSETYVPQVMPPILGTFERCFRVHLLDSLRHTFFYSLCYRCCSVGSSVSL